MPEVITTEELNEKIRRKNAEFAAMGPAERRVAIAKDVIEHLDAKKIVAKKGSWARLEGMRVIATRTEGTFSPDEQFCDVLETLEKCNTCALGGLFVCTVKKANALPVRDFMADDGEWLMIDEAPLRRYMMQFFSEEQLTLIEIAFEGGMGAYRVLNRDPDQVAAAAVFTETVPNQSACNCDSCRNGSKRLDGTSDDERLRLIMGCLIRNNGTFVPTDVRPKEATA